METLRLVSECHKTSGCLINEWHRQRSGQHHPVRALDVRTSLCADHFRSYYCAGTCVRLQDLRYWVRITYSAIVVTLTASRYLNGSILIATLQPSFTILHTLTTPRAPSPVAGLAWHGSSSKQKSEMLAAQMSDGDLRVWSVPKVPHSGDAPCVIRILNKKEQREPGPCWFAWSKNGRIVQYTEGYVRH